MKQQVKTDSIYDTIADKYLNKFNMETTLLMVTTETGTTQGYIIGAIIAIAILGYLIYSLLKPEKF